MPARLPDRARSYAVIIGASEYQDEKYPQVDAITYTAERFASLISTKRMWHLPAENIRQLVGRVTVAEAAAAIEQAAARRDIDGLFIYLCTHGRRWTEEYVPDRELHFALSDSAWHRSFTHLPFRWVRWQLARKATAANTVLVIDSCWSDDSFLRLGAEPPEPPRVPGVCTMTATRERRLADANWRDTRFTAFSGALIEVVEQGVDKQGEYLTPKTVFEALRGKLAESYPEPDMLVNANGDDVFLCRNRKFAPPETHPPLDELLGELNGPQSLDPAVFATAIEKALGPDSQPGTVPALLGEFAGKRPPQEVIRLADRLRSRDVTIVNEQADRLIELWYARRDGPDIARLLHLLDGHDGHDSGDIDVREVLVKLRDRSPEITADLRASLRKAGCPGCAAIGHQVDGQMLDVWPQSRHAELLAVLH